MKKIYSIILVWLFLLGSVCYADMPSLPPTPADKSKTDTTDFGGILSTEATVQDALDTIDDVTLDSTDALNKLFEGVTVAALTIGDANPPVASGGLYNTTGATTVTITDFYDSGNDNDGDFADGDFFGVIVNDADFTIDFATGTNIKGNADTNFTGIAANPVLIIFVWRSGVWYSENLNSGFSDPLTMSAKISSVLTTISGNDTLTAAEQYNGRIIVTAASVLNLAAVAVGMDFAIISHTASDVDMNPDNADTVTMNGVAAAAGDAHRITDLGVVIQCTYSAANSWSCVSDAATDVN